MATKILLHAVLVGIVSSALGYWRPLMWPHGKEFQEMCNKVFNQSAMCDEVVASGETFKKNKGKYKPLLPSNAFVRTILQCVESTLSIAEMQKVCGDAKTFKKALKCYREIIMDVTPPEAQKIIGELVSVYENCMLGLFNSSMPSTTPPKMRSTMAK